MPIYLYVHIHSTARFNTCNTRAPAQRTTKTKTQTPSFEKSNIMAITYNLRILHTQSRNVNTWKWPNIQIHSCSCVFVHFTMSSVGFLSDFEAIWWHTGMADLLPSMSSICNSALELFLKYFYVIFLNLSRFVAFLFI